MLFYVIVYECVLVQMLSARSGVHSFNRLSNHLFPTVHMRSFCCGSPGFLSSVPVCSFIVMIPFSLRKSFALAPYTLQFEYM